MKLTNYQHIIWDWNGTLVNDASLCLEIINHLLASHHHPSLTLEEYQAAFNFPVEAYYQRIGFDFSKESFASLAQKFNSAYSNRRFECSLHSQATDLLTFFSQQEITQSILSAYHQESLREAVQFYQIESFFSQLTGLDNDHASGKMELGKKYISSLTFSPDQILLIGDTTHDCEVAQAMGIDCILIANGHHSKQRLTACGVPVFDNLETLYLECSLTKVTIPGK